MASYPNIGIDNGSRFTGDDDTQVDFASDGTIRGRVGFGATIYNGQIIHNLITSTERDTLVAFYETNKTVSFTFTYDGSTYTMRFKGKPKEQHLQGGWWRVDVQMIGNKD